MSSEKVPSNMRKLCRFSSSCPCAKYHPGLRSPFIHSVVSNYSVSGQWRPWSDCADAQSDLGLRCPHVPEDTFSYGAAQLKIRDFWNSSNFSSNFVVSGVYKCYRIYSKYWDTLKILIIVCPKMPTCCHCVYNLLDAWQTVLGMKALIRRRILRRLL